MCGIAGQIQKNQKPVETDALHAMAAKLSHRGPDDQGIWQKGSAGLAHRRLAIIDLSPSGKQPMLSGDGRYVIVFNGEIYNYLELTKELEKNGTRFRSKSDTEVLLRLYERHGKDMLGKLRGMFAFAIWDQEERRLFFARDRLGQKPLFYRHDHESFSFASDLRALRRTDDEIDPEAVRLFFGLQYVPSPKTGFKNIFSLPRGAYGLYSDGELEIHSYCEFRREPKLDIGIHEAANEVRRLLEQSVRYRLIADVPVGLFLSGGIDSASVAHLAAPLTDKPLRTFTMGFTSDAFDERAEAERIARSLGTDHVSFEATPEALLASADKVIAEYAAPYADSSSLPTYALAAEASKSVKTLMTGDGGDELFAGYRRYRYYALGARLRKARLSGPVALLASGASMLTRNPGYARFGAMMNGLRASYGAGYAELFAGSYFHSAAERVLLRPDFLQSTATYSATAFITNRYRESFGLEGALDFDLNSYLPDDLNVKMDRATMAHGLEARSPFQDHELVDFVTRLPVEFLFEGEGQKPLLAKALHGTVPDEIFLRKKKGFQVPLAEWFRGPLKSAFEERCLSADAKLLSYCEREEVLRYLRGNDAGEDHGNRLWMLYSLSTWLTQV